jgi:hypothetical protein
LIESKIPKKLCLITAILISRKIIKIWDIWPHLSSFVETKDEVDEVEHLLKKQFSLVEYEYKQLFESVMNKEAYEKDLKVKLAEQVEIER